MTETKEQIYRKHFREFYKNDFPPARLEQWVDRGMLLTEQLQAVYLAMDEYAAKFAIKKLQEVQEKAIKLLADHPREPELNADPEKLWKMTAWDNIIDAEILALKSGT